MDMGRNVSVEVMKLIVDWLKGMSTSPAVFSVKVRNDIQEDVAIRRDFLQLGMEQYCKHFTRNICSAIREGFIGLPQIACIENNAKDNDAVWECLTNNLAMLRVKKTIPEPEKFEDFLKKHPRLAQAIGSVERHIKNNRNGRSGTSTPRRGDKRKGAE